MKHLFLCLLIGAGLCASAQADTAKAPYLRFPELPPLQLLLPDSTTYFTKANVPANMPVLYMLFDPNCSHCQHETEEIMAHKEEFSNIQIVMVAMARVSFDEVNYFVRRFKLDELKHVVVGKDMTYFMISFYPIHNFPFLAAYDGKGKLITVSEGSIGMDKVLGFFNGK